MSRLKAVAERFAREAKAQPAQVPDLDPLAVAAEEFASAKTPGERADAFRTLAELASLEKRD